MKIKLLQQAMILTLVAAFNIACTVTQQHEEAVTGAIGNNVSDGFVGELGIGANFQGYVFQGGAIDKYNALIDMYGSAPQTINNEPIGFVPAIKKNDGVMAFAPGIMLEIWHLKTTSLVKSDGLFLMDRQHARSYKEMIWWAANGVPRQTFIRSLLP